MRLPPRVAALFHQPTPRVQGVTRSTVTPAQVELEQRLTAALMLQQNLVATEFGVAPAADSTLQTRHEQARREVLNRLRTLGSVSAASAEL